MVAQRKSGLWHRIHVVKSLLADRETVERYLPENYRVMADQGEHLVVEGHDSHGWTAEGYVLPRLASGLIAAKIVACVPVPGSGWGES